MKMPKKFYFTGHRKISESILPDRIIMKFKYDLYSTDCGKTKI